VDQKIFVNKKILLSLGGATLLALVFLFKGCLSVDRCLDAGGCWDETDNVCRKDELNAQELCDRNR
jgi:hypothetical protein